MDDQRNDNPKAAEPAPTSYCGRFDREDPDQQEVSKILAHLKDDLSLLGIYALGKDGVLRSLTADRDVIDAAGLTPKLIKALQDRVPPDARGDLGDADGTKVPREEWFHPDKSLLPPPLSEEKREQARKRWEEDPEMYREKVEKLRKKYDAA